MRFVAPARPCCAGFVWRRGRRHQWPATSATLRQPSVSGWAALAVVALAARRRPTAAARGPKAASCTVRSTLDADACADAFQPSTAAAVSLHRRPRLPGPRRPCAGPCSGRTASSTCARRSTPTTCARRLRRRRRRLRGRRRPRRPRPRADDGLAPRPLLLPGAVLLELRGRSALDADDVRRALDACAADAFRVDDVRDGLVLASAPARVPTFLSQFRRLISKRSGLRGRRWRYRSRSWGGSWRRRRRT